MLRDPLQTALNDLLGLLKEAVVHYADTAQRAGSGCGELFTRLGRERREQAEQLSVLVQQSGDLPDAVDTELESWHLLWKRLREGLDDATRVQLRDASALEHALAEQARRLYEQAPPTPVCDWAAAAQVRFSAAAKELDALLEA